MTVVFFINTGRFKNTRNRTPLGERKYVWVRAVLLCCVVWAGSCQQRACPGEDPPGPPYSDSTPTSPPLRRIFVLGLDGLSWNLLGPLVEEGQLPHFKKLIDEGSSGVLESFHPMRSPSLWTTVATGVMPAEHGITGFQFTDPRTGRMTPPISLLRKRHAIWNILTSRGRPVLVNNWWATWPVEPISGIMISDQFPDDPNAKDVYPPELRADMLAMTRPRTDPKYREFIASYIHPHPDQFLSYATLPHLRRAFDHLHRWWRKDRITINTTQGLLTSKPFPDIFFTYLRGTDTTAHYFFGYGSRWARRARWVDDPAISDQLGEVVPGYYRYVDHLLGQWLPLIPPDALVIILSDHGFKLEDVGQVETQINTVLGMWGYTQFDSQGRVDKPRSQVYAIFPDPYSQDRHIHINWDQFPQAQQDPVIKQQVFRSLTRKLKERLQTIRSEGGAMFPRIDVFSPTDDTAMILHLNRGAIRDTLWIEDEEVDLERVFRFVPWTGGHTIAGVLIVSGTGVKRGYRMPPHSLKDITRTLLCLQGFPQGHDMVGAPIRDFWMDSSLRTAPCPEIETYGDFQPRTGSVEESSLHKKNLEELCSLGYIQC